MEIESGNWLSESASGGDIIEQLTSSGKFQYNVDNGFLLTIGFLDNSILSVFNKIHNIGVVKLAHSLNFSHNELEELSVQVGVTLL